jgi:hypothetical protein
VLPNVLWGGVWGFVSSIVLAIAIGVLSPSSTAVNIVLIQFLALGGPMTIHAWVALIADYRFWDDSLGFRDAQGRPVQASTLRSPLRTYLFRALLAPGAILVVVVIASVFAIGLAPRVLISEYVVWVTFAWFTAVGIAAGLALRAGGINLDDASLL